VRNAKLALMAASVVVVSSLTVGPGSPRVLAGDLVVLPAHRPPVDPGWDDDRKSPRPLIQVALLLDTSNSMDGLIDQARTQLWTIVNEFARCKRQGRTPRLQVALYEYGNDSLPGASGHVRLVQPFTSDLDLVSEKLWGLRTNGGNEYCGAVIASATRELAWADADESLDRNVYRAIFIAGNEPFTQGAIDYRSATGMAVGRGVVVNTIHCGPDEDGRSGQWADAARRGEGRYMTIDHDRAIRGIIAPQDEKIRRLSLELNTTYIPYGASGGEGLQRQGKQDRLAVDAPAAAAANASVQRAVVKAQKQYDNSGWDLVDAAREKKVRLDELKPDALPEPMRAMNAAEREAYVKEQAAKRADLQKQITDLNAERVRYVAEEQRKQTGGAETLDSAMIKVVQEQLKERKFEVGETK
jgi:hypothetical protein